MNTLVLAGSLACVTVSSHALYAFIELSVAYWTPARARERWTKFVEQPKLEYFAPSFRWLMPLFAVVALVQLVASARVLFAAIGIN